MTRRDALWDFNSVGVEKKINQIFDYFESKTCDNCTHKPNEGDNYPETCGTCSWFYTDNFEPKIN